MSDENVSMVGKPAEGFGHVKKAFADIAQLKVGDGLGELSKLGGEFVAGSVGAVGAYLVADVLKNPNLKPSQKVLPSIGYGLTIAAAVPLTVALIAGASALVPPFMFVASVAGVAKNMGTYLEERAERNNLRKELMSTDQMLSQVDKAKLSDEDKAKVKSAILEPQQIYKDLYQLRKDVIESDKIAPDQKQQLVQSLNKSIEDFAKGDLKSINLNTQGLPQDLQEKVSKQSAQINQRLTTYNEASQAMQDMNLPKSLAKNIQAYQSTREKIYAQDLPPQIKEKMSDMLEGKKVSKSVLNNLYLRVGQQYLNDTTTDQLKTQDQLVEKGVGKVTKDPAEVKAAMDFCQKPREVYDALKAMQLKIEQHPFAPNEQNDKKQMLEALDKFTERFKNNPDMASHWRESFQKEFVGKHPAMEDAAKAVDKQLAEFDKISTDYKQTSLFQEQARLQALKSPTQAESEQLSKMNKVLNGVASHQHQSLNQHASTLGQQFPSPKIDFELKKHDLVAKAGSKISDKASQLADKARVSSAFKAVSSVAKSGPLKRLFKDASEQGPKAKTAEKEDRSLKSDFKDRYGATFNVMEKKQRSHFLEASVPRRLANVGMSAGMCLLSLASTFIIPAVASPAAPVAAGATVAVAAASTALVVASTVNSVDLVRKNMAGNIKLSGAKSDITKAVEPKASKKAKSHDSSEPTVSLGADLQQAATATAGISATSPPPEAKAAKKAGEPQAVDMAATMDRFKSVLAELGTTHHAATAEGPSRSVTNGHARHDSKQSSLTAFGNARAQGGGESLRQLAQGGAPTQAAPSQEAEKSGPKTHRAK